MRRPKYRLEVDCGGRECSRFEPRYSNYGCIVAEGDSLEECLDNATVDIIDQDGGTLWDGPADTDWMQDLVRAEFLSEPDRAAAHDSAAVQAFLQLSDECSRGE